MSAFSYRTAFNFAINKFKHSKNSRVGIKNLINDLKLNTAHTNDKKSKELMSKLHIADMSLMTNSIERSKLYTWSFIKKTKGDPLNLRMNGDGKKLLGIMHKLKILSDKAIQMTSSEMLKARLDNEFKLPFEYYSELYDILFTSHARQVYIAAYKYNFTDYTKVLTLWYTITFYTFISYTFALLSREGLETYVDGGYTDELIMYINDVDNYLGKTIQKNYKTKGNLSVSPMDSIEGVIKSNREIINDIDEKEFVKHMVNKNASSSESMAYDDSLPESLSGIKSEDMANESILVAIGVLLAIPILFPLIRHLIYMFLTWKIDFAKYLMHEHDLLELNLTDLKYEIEKERDPKRRKKLEEVRKKQLKWQEDLKNLSLKFYSEKTSDDAQKKYGDLEMPKIEAKAEAPKEEPPQSVPTNTPSQSTSDTGGELSIEF